MKGLVLKMSCHKFASNVVEKILVYADHDTKQKIVSEVLHIEYGIDPVHAMMVDAYGSEHRPEFIDLNLAFSDFHLKIMLSKQHSIKSKETKENSCMPVSGHISRPSSVSQGQRSSPSISLLVSGDS